jgi:hypothetical protein
MKYSIYINSNSICSHYVTKIQNFSRTVNDCCVIQYCTNFSLRYFQLNFLSNISFQLLSTIVCRLLTKCIQFALPPTLFQSVLIQPFLSTNVNSIVCFLSIHKVKSVCRHLTKSFTPSHINILMNSSILISLRIVNSI